MRVRLRLDALQQLLARSAISQNHWAARLGLSKGHLSNLLAGRHLYPSARTRERMLEVLGVTFDALFEVEPGGDLPDHPVQNALHDRYLIDQVVGQGGMGTVYLARDVILGRAVALKLVSAEVVSGVGSRAMLKEIINTTRLQHHHILPVLDCGEVEGSPFYVLPYIRGGSLRQLLDRRGRLPVGLALTIAGGLAAALDHAHGLGILHCDVKPANVLLSDSHPYLIDFGVARVVQSEVFSAEGRGSFDSGAGTPAYVSPEQARGESDLDCRADVYSLAGTLFEMLAGRPPFVGETTMATVARRFVEDPPDLRAYAPHLPSQLADALRRGMARERADRPATAGAFLAECHRAVAVAGSVVGVASPTRTMQSELTWRDRAAIMQQNVRQAWRTVVRSPAVAITIALTLGLGVGINTVMYQIIDRLFFRPPAGVSAPGELRRVYSQRSFGGIPSVSSGLSYPALEDIRALRSFRGAAASFPSAMPLGEGLDAPVVNVLMTTHNFLPLVGVPVFRGRFFDASEDAAGVGGTVVITHAFWKKRMNADPDAVGKTIRLARTLYTVIGITGEGFTGIDPQPVEAFVPLLNAAAQQVCCDITTNRGLGFVDIVARVPAGQSDEVATADATRRWQEGNRTTGQSAGESAVLGPLLEAQGPLASRDSRVSKWAAGMALALLLIACANVANLMLTRLTHRETEFAIRGALGATRRQLLGTVALDSLLLTLLATIVGLVLAHVGGRVLVGSLVPDTVWPSPLADVRVVLLTIGVALLAGALAGLIPAWLNIRVGSPATLRGGRGAIGAPRASLRRALLIGQTVLSVALLIVAGLFVRSVRELRQMDAGLDLPHLLMVQARHDSTYTKAQAAAMQLELMSRLTSIPGVRGVTGRNSTPLRSASAEELSIPGIDSLPHFRTGGPYINVVGPDYFRVAGTHIIKGRGFVATDDHAGARVAVVGSTMAREIWHTGDPIGHCLKIGGDTMPCYNVIGVAQDAPRSSLLDRSDAQYYVPAAQFRPDAAMSVLFVQTSDDADKHVAEVDKLARSTLHGLRSLTVQPGWTLAGNEVRNWTVGARMFSVFGMLALIVAAIGLYGVVSFDVARRTRELGIRMALGATTNQLTGSLVTGGVKPIAVGILVGIIVIVAGASWLQPLLFQTNARDPLVIGAVGVLLLLVAVGSVLAPAFRAAKREPTVALRAD